MRSVVKIVYLNRQAYLRIKNLISVNEDIRYYTNTDYIVCYLGIMSLKTNLQ